MLHFFQAGPDQVRWELTAIDNGQSYRLAVYHAQGMAVYHAQGMIVEYFTTAAMAIMRVQELEDVLVRARGIDEPVPVGLPS
jgi:hypothetical protein